MNVGSISTQVVFRTMALGEIAQGGGESIGKSRGLRTKAGERETGAHILKTLCFGQAFSAL